VQGKEKRKPIQTFSSHEGRTLPPWQDGEAKNGTDQKNRIGRMPKGIFSRTAKDEPGKEGPSPPKPQWGKRREKKKGRQEDPTGTGRLMKAMRKNPACRGEREGKVIFFKEFGGGEGWKGKGEGFRCYGTRGKTPVAGIVGCFVNGTARETKRFRGKTECKGESGDQPDKKNRGNIRSTIRENSIIGR